MSTDPLRDYLRHYTANNLAAWSAAVDAMSAEDRALIEAYHDAFDDHATKNVGLLADLTDAIYGKGTAETRGYPRGMVAKARRVFNLLRRMRKADDGEPLLVHVSKLLKEVK